MKKILWHGELRTHFDPTTAKTAAKKAQLIFGADCEASYSYLSNSLCFRPAYRPSAIEMPFNPEKMPLSREPKRKK